MSLVGLFLLKTSLYIIDLTLKYPVVFFLVCNCNKFILAYSTIILNSYSNIIIILYAVIMTFLFTDNTSMVQTYYTIQG